MKIFGSLLVLILGSTSTAFGMENENRSGSGGRCPDRVVVPYNYQGKIASFPLTWEETTENLVWPTESDPYYPYFNPSINFYSPTYYYVKQEKVLNDKGKWKCEPILSSLYSDQLKKEIVPKPEHSNCTAGEIAARRNPDGCSGGLPFDKERFFAACVQHDICYATLGVSKAKCDSQFLKNMNNICSHSGGSCRNAALAFHTAVVFGGWGSVKKNEGYLGAQAAAKKFDCL